MIFVAGLFFGAAAAWLFRRLTDRAAVRATVSRILARLLELRLFLDEPAIVLRAQSALLAENLRLLRHIALPAAVTAVAFALLCGPLDNRFGRGPSGRTGDPVVMSAPLPEGAIVETPPVRVPRLRQTFWRVRVPVTSGPPWEVWFSTSAVCGGVLIALL